jgi:hypothetical protein
MDLDLDVVSMIGRKPRGLSAEIMRELTESDLALLDTERGIQPSHITRLSERHHALARCLATGLSVSDACAITGYTPSRVSILKGDPSFEELIAFYQGPNAQLAQDYGTKAAIARNMATDLIIDKMEEKPQEVSIGEAIDIHKTYADRTGQGPQSRQQHLHMHIGVADKLKAARQRTPEGPRLIEGTSAPTISPGDTNENS